MRVICIDATERTTRKSLEAPFNWWIVEGDTYTVIFSGQTEWGQLVYVLAEQPITQYEGSWIGFEADRFIELSEIDEMELVNVKQEELEHV